MEIPTDLIHRLQSSLAEAASTSSASPPPPPPFLSVADAVAAFDASSAWPSPELRCERCSSSGGLLRGSLSAACVYCGSARREEGAGGGVAFGATAAAAWLLGSLGLDGSEPVNLDTEPMDSSKGKETPKSGMILSNLLDLKVTWPCEDKETPKSSKNKEQPSVTYALNLSGVDLDSFFTEAKERPAAALPCNDPAVQKQKSSTSHGTSSSGTYAYTSSEGFNSSGINTSSPSTNNIESTPKFANWDADFQSTGSQNAVVESDQVDLFQNSSTAESFSLPIAGTTINQGVDMENEAKIKNTRLELSEDFGKLLTSDKLVQDDLFNKIDTQPVSGSDTRGITQTSGGELTSSPFSKNSIQDDPLLVSGNTGDSTDEAFDDWQGFTAGGGKPLASDILVQDGLFNKDDIQPLSGDNTGGITLTGVGELSRSTFSKNSVQDESLPVSGHTGDSTDEAFDDWQEFTAGGGSPLANDILAQDDLFNKNDAQPVSGDNIGGITRASGGELSRSILSKNSVQDDPLPLSGNSVHSTDEAFDEWRGFTTENSNQGNVSNCREQAVKTSPSDPSGIKTAYSWPVRSFESSSDVKVGDDNGKSFDDLQDFATCSGQGDGVLMKQVDKTASISYEHSSETKALDLWPIGNFSGSKNAKMVNESSDSFDDWQDFASSSQAEETKSNPVGDIMGISNVSPPEIEPKDLWFVGNFKKSSNSELMNGNDDWHAFTNSGKAQQSSSTLCETNLSFEHHKVTESMDLWLTSNSGESRNAESASIENNSFDIWQDFTFSGQPQENSSNLGVEVMSISSEHPKEYNSRGLWLTSNFKEAKRTEVVDGNNDSSDDWQGFTNSVQMQKNLAVHGEGQKGLFVKDHLETEPLDLWAPDSAKEFKNIGQMNENIDLFDDWQDFTSSSPREKSLPSFSDASLINHRSASKPDVLLGVEYGSYAQSTLPQKLADKKESSNEANDIPCDAHLDRANGMQQTTGVDLLSTKWATTSLDDNHTSKEETVDAKVAKLLSQMHDLSFMLEDDLSVPNKPVDPHSKS